MAREIPKQLQLRVFYRDRWHCTYCKNPIFFSPALKLMEGISPGHGYYDQHGKRGAMLALLENSCACCDHVVPYSKGGETVEANLVAACFACNRNKSDGPAPGLSELPATPRPASWDGFVSLYPVLQGADPKWCKVIAEEPRG